VKLAIQSEINPRRVLLFLWKLFSYNVPETSRALRLHAAGFLIGHQIFNISASSDNPAFIPNSLTFDLP